MSKQDEYILELTIDLLYYLDIEILKKIEAASKGSHSIVC